MTRAAALLSLLIALAAACGGSDAPATTPSSTDEPGASTAEEPSSSEEPGTAEQPAAAPARALGCDKEVALTCDKGFTDGCLSKLTVVHACVADSEKKAGPPACKMEIARQCPDGQVDACSTKPRQARTHVCVVAPK